MNDWFNSNKPMYYVFNLDQYPKLGQHRPYYKTVGHLMSLVLELNISYRTSDDLHIAEVVNRTLLGIVDPTYLGDDPVVLLEIERIASRLLKYMHRDNDPVVISTDVIVKENMLIVGVSQWF